MTISLMFLFLAIIFNTLASTFFKYSSLQKDTNTLSIILLVSGLFFGAINALFYTRSLKTIDLSIAYTIFSAGSIILITMVSLILFKESLTVPKAVGIGIICFGMYLVS
jgi:small multidrug resistance pump